MNTKESVSVGDADQSVPPPSVGAAVALVSTGVALALFDYFSFSSSFAARGFYGAHAPIYGLFRPYFSAMGWLGVVVVILAAATTWVVHRTSSVKPWIWLLVAICISFSLSASLAVSRPDRQGIPGRTFRMQVSEYQLDVGLVKQMGPRNFVENFPQIVGGHKLHGNHSITHPPAALLLLFGLEQLWPHHLVPPALVLGFIASLIVAATWLMARHLADENVAAIAAVLIAVAPGPVIFGFTSMDAVFATALALVGALFIWTWRSDDPRVGFGAGLATGLAAFVTYAVSFVGIFGVILLVGRRPIRKALRLLAWVIVGILVGVAALKLFVGFDLWKSYHAFSAVGGFTAYMLSRPRLYWAFGEWAAWLTYIGLPLAAGVILSLFTKARAFTCAILVPIAIVYLLPSSVTKLLAGETERTWLFLVPFAAVVTAKLLNSLVPNGKRAWLLGAMVLIAGLQAIILNAKFLNFY